MATLIGFSSLIGIIYSIIYIIIYTFRFQKNNDIPGASKPCSQENNL